MSGELGVNGVGRKEFDDLLFDLVDNSAERKDVQYTLATLEKVDDLFPAAHQHRLVSVDYQVGGGDVFAEFVLEVVEDLADLFEANA